MAFILGWVPAGLYFGYQILLQSVSGTGHTVVQIIGDVLTVFCPMFALPIAINGAAMVSPNEFNDPNLSISDVFSWKSRTWYALLCLVASSIIYWGLLYRLSSTRPAVEKMQKDEDYEPLLRQDFDE